MRGAPTRMGRISERRAPGFAGWLGLAVLVHAAALGLVALSVLRWFPSVPALPEASAPLSLQDLSLQDIDMEESATEPSGAMLLEPSVPAEARAEPAQPGPEPTHRSRMAAAARASKLPYEAATPPRPAALAADAAGAGEAAAETQPARPERQLSLAELGVAPAGGAQNPFLVPTAPRRPGPPRALQREALNRRIEHVLRSGLAEHDQSLGLGPEGPAVAAVLDLVQQSTTTPNTSALIELRTDGKGHTVHVAVLDASNDTDAWNTIAEELQHALVHSVLRVPAGSGGVTFQLRVVSRVQLPSGADPGLAVELFGQKIKKGAGDRATTISILSPKLAIVQTPYIDGRTLPVVAFAPNVLGVRGDLADIGGVARRVVHAYLVALETHPPDAVER